MSKQQHAAHNKKLCEKLYEENEFRDWVITTAFYASIHYVDAQIFPRDYNGEHLPSIDKAKAFLQKSAHQTRLKLVQELLPNIYKDFKFLHDNCLNARYIDYHIDEDTSQKAKKYLDTIATTCQVFTGSTTFFTPAH